MLRPEFESNLTKNTIHASKIVLGICVVFFLVAYAFLISTLIKDKDYSQYSNDALCIQMMTDSIKQRERAIKVLLSRGIDPVENERCRTLLEMARQ